MLKAEKANIEINKISLPINSLQYHANNRHATWLELFFDLVFVASIDVVTHHLAHVHQGHIGLKQLMLFPVEFLPIWWIWATHMLYANHFDTDSRQHRLASLAIMPGDHYVRLCRWRNIYALPILHWFLYYYSPDISGFIFVFS